MWNEWQENVIAVGGGAFTALIIALLSGYNLWVPDLLGAYLVYGGIDYSVWVAPIFAAILIFASFFYGRSAKAKLAGTIGLVLLVMSFPMILAPYFI